MRIQGRIEEIVQERNEQKSADLWNATKKIIDDVTHHIRLINSQMSNYDIHDDSHSEKVIEIIENILADKVGALSFYELILLYLSAYLHDSAMAMPSWEYDVLKAVEGMENFCDNTLEFKICNDFKPVHKFSDAKEIIVKNVDKLFAYEESKEFIFSYPTEEETIDSLAELICSYEEFRNGYIFELEKSKGSISSYMDISKMIRSKYIRQTHHVRVADNVIALRNRFEDAIGKVYSDMLVRDLSSVCRCHGEKIEELFDLDLRRRDWRHELSNIQFVAMLVRLGDIIHFSSDRAPLSLFAEKRIRDEISFKHWNTKFQDLQYEFYTEKDNIVIKYIAYCSGPEVYYFIQDYLDAVDNELDNYFLLRRRWETERLPDSSKWFLPLSEKVDRDEIRYDSNLFIPRKNMRFVLNQSKILELLMGVQLYKDCFLCLREIYQNALDASKCMLAINNKDEIRKNLSIEFGVGEDLHEGTKQKYIYCLDHGTGMNEYIINNYLLCIGNSYY